MSINLYTVGNMAAAVVDSATSEATGFPKENLADFNPDTYWKMTSTATWTIDIDLQSAKQCDGICLWVKNCGTAFYNSSPDTHLKVQSSPDDSSYTTRYDENWDLSVGTNPIYIKDFAASYTYRYWRIIVNEPLAVMQISAIWLLRKFTLSIAHQFPNMDGFQFHNRISKAAGGRTFVTAINSRMGYYLPRTYVFGSSDYGQLYNAFIDSYGTRYPLIYNDGAAYEFMRFESDLFVKNETTGSLYSPSVTFVSEPWIPDGSTY